MNITQRLNAAKHELEQRLGVPLSVLSTDGGWALYKEFEPASLQRIAGPLPKNELIQWCYGASYSLVCGTKENVL
jgi:hypothetical protein